MRNKARRLSRQAERRRKDDPATRIRGVQPPASMPRRKGGRSDMLAFIDRFPDLGPAAVAVTLASVYLLGKAIVEGLFALMPKLARMTRRDQRRGPAAEAQPGI